MKYSVSLTQERALAWPGRMVALSAVVAIFATVLLSTAPAGANGSLMVDAVGPVNGIYTLQNEQSGQFLDADSDGDVQTSDAARADDVWQLTNLGDGVYTLQNEQFGGFLDSDPDRTVDLSPRVGNDDLWKAIPAESGAFYFRNTRRGLFLSQVGNQIVITADETSAERWKLESPVSDFVGQTVAVKSVETGRWLDADRNRGSIDQSLIRRADDLWNVLDAGNGYVYLQSAVTSRVLGANGANGGVGSSGIPTSDNLWRLVRIDPSTYQLRSIDFDSYMTALGGTDFRVVTRRDGLSDATLWHVYDENDSRAN